MKNMIWITLPIALLFGALLWIQIFLITMHHYRKFENQMKLGLSIRNATMTAIIVVGIAETALYILYNQFIK